MKARTPVLMIGLDGADQLVVERLIDQEKLPTLARLRQRGCYGVLSSPAGQYAGGVWPSFYTGQGVPWHGIYHNKLWRPAAMRCEVPTDRWLGARPFWETWQESALRVCIMDVPMILGRPRRINGVYLGGWGTHDLISRGSWPGSLWSELRHRHGGPLMPAEQFGMQSGKSLLRLRDSLLRSTEQARDIACDLLGRERWDFSCIVFGGIHRMGHYLTDLSQVAEAGLPADDSNKLRSALDEIYQATDRAIERVLEHVSSDTLVITFAVHGMAPNPGWGDLAADILQAMQYESTGKASRPGLLYSLKKRVPMHWARPVLSRLPSTITDSLVSLWSARMQDWNSARVFPMPMDHAAYLRVNLRGRERKGIVDDGEYQAECAQVANWFEGLRDRDSGERIAGEVARAYSAAPASATHRELLPDLVISWNGPPASASRALVCDSLPSLCFEVPTRLPSGRSGNHAGRGWFIAAGPGAAAGTRTRGHDILDLAPTVLHCLGAGPLQALQGARIELAGPEA